MKAILVIDMPKCCDECHLCLKQLYENEWTAHCQVYCEDIYDLDIINKNCPLKPLPRKKDEISVDETIKKNVFGLDTIILEKAIDKARQQGYNACLDEILGEE